jgi:hypothetical protein
MRDGAVAVPSRRPSSPSVPHHSRRPSSPSVPHHSRRASSGASEEAFGVCLLAGTSRGCAWQAGRNNSGEPPRRSRLAETHVSCLLDGQAARNKTTSTIHRRLRAFLEPLELRMVGSAETWGLLTRELACVAAPSPDTRACVCRRFVS